MSQIELSIHRHFSTGSPRPSISLVYPCASIMVHKPTVFFDETCANTDLLHNYSTSVTVAL
jgi:hypothetical protein